MLDIKLDQQSFTSLQGVIISDRLSRHMSHSLDVKEVMMMVI